MQKKDCKHIVWQRPLRRLGAHRQRLVPAAACCAHSYRMTRVSQARLSCHAVSASRLRLTHQCLRALSHRSCAGSATMPCAQPTHTPLPAGGDHMEVDARPLAPHPAPAAPEHTAKPSAPNSTAAAAAQPKSDPSTGTGGDDSASAPGDAAHLSTAWLALLAEHPASAAESAQLAQVARRMQVLALYLACTVLLPCCCCKCSQSASRTPHAGTGLVLTSWLVPCCCRVVVTSAARAGPAT